MRILVIKRDKLGDLLLTRPVLSCLAQATAPAEIHLLANDYNAWVAQDHPALSRTWVYPRVRSDGRLHIGAALRQLPLGWQLRRQRFDWALVLGGDESHRAIRRAMASGAKRIVAYAREPARYGARLTDPLPPPGEGHEIARMLALLAPLDVHGMAVEAPVFAASADAATFATQWLAARGLAPRRHVVIGLGARRAKKQPSADQVVRWSARIFAEHGLATVMMWTPGKASNAAYPGDDALAQQVLDRGVANLHAFRGPIQQALGLIYSARASIMPDSGLMHFAAASPGGVLGLFADPLDSAPASRWAPVGPRARHLEAAKRVADLPDGEVFRELDALLGTASANASSTPISDFDRDTG